MSSTTGIQNLLVNVFRPVYTYDATATLYTPKLELSNIDTYSGNSVSVFTAAVGDSRNNVYVGSNAGNPYTTPKACTNVTAVGYGAGSNISNVSNSTYVGYYAGAGAASASNVVAIGANSVGDGVSNVYVGTNTGSTGSSNIYIGTATIGMGSGNILIGNGLNASTSNNTFRLGSNYLYGKLDTQWLGLGTPAPTDPVNGKLDVSGNVYVKGQVGINLVPVRTLDVNGNFRASDAFGTLDFNLGVTSSSNGFASTRGTTTVSGGVTTIGTLKRGTVLVSAVNTTTTSKHAARHLLAYTDTAATDLASNVSGGSVSITLSTSNIEITDAANGTYAWSITYFPLP